MSYSKILEFSSEQKMKKFLLSWSLDPSWRSWAKLDQLELFSRVLHADSEKNTPFPPLIESCNDTIPELPAAMSSAL